MLLYQHKKLTRYISWSPQQCQKNGSLDYWGSELSRDGLVDSVISKREKIYLDMQLNVLTDYGRTDAIICTTYLF